MTAQKKQKRKTKKIGTSRLESCGPPPPTRRGIGPGRRKRRCFPRRTRRSTPSEPNEARHRVGGGGTRQERGSGKSLAQPFSCFAGSDTRSIMGAVRVHEHSFQEGGWVGLGSIRHRCRYVRTKRLLWLRGEWHSWVLSFFRGARRASKPSAPMYMFRLECQLRLS